MYKTKNLFNPRKEELGKEIIHLLNDDNIVLIDKEGWNIKLKYKPK